MIKKLLLTCGLAAALLVVVWSAAIAHHDEPTMIDGIAVPAGAPAPNQVMPVAGPNGDLIRCADGQVLQVTMNQAMTAPPVARAVPESRANGVEVYRVTDSAVPRCGPGGSDDPVWVPSSVGRKLRDAPARWVARQERYRRRGPDLPRGTADLQAR